MTTQDRRSVQSSIIRKVFVSLSLSLSVQRDEMKRTETD